MPGPVRIAILANGRQARAELRGVATEADLLGKTVGRAGKLLAAGFAFDRLARGAAAFVQTGGSYVETLNRLQAVSGASQREISNAGATLEAQADQYAKLGQNSGDAANGALELAKAGLSLQDSLKATYATAVLAKAGQLEVADASELVANTLNTFNLKAEQAADIANDLANAANISSADVADLAESFKYVSPLAAKSGVSLAQTNAVLAELANSGVKASDAGTGFRKFLASLQAPTGIAAKAINGLGVEVYDAQGKMKPLGTIIDDLRGSLGDLTQQQQNKALRDIFGLTGITSASIILKNGAEGLDRYTKGVERVGGASKAAEAGSKGLLGTLRSLRAETITGADAFYRQYSPAVDRAIKADLPKVLNAAQSAGEALLPTLSSLATTVVDLGHDVGEVAQGPVGDAFVGSLKLVVGLTKTASDVLDAIPGPIRKVGLEAGAGALLLGKLSTTMSGVQRAYGAASTVKFESGLQRTSQAIGVQVRSLQGLRSELLATQRQATVTRAVTGAATGAGTSLVGTTLPNQASATRYAAGLQVVERQSISTRTALARMGQAASGAAGIAGLGLLAAGAQTSNRELSTLETTAGAAAAGFAVGGPAGAAVGAFGGLVYSLGEKFNKAGLKAQAAYNQMASANPVKDAQTALAGLKASLDQVTGAYTATTRAAVYQQLAAKPKGGGESVLETAANLGISSRAVVDAALGQGNALRTLTPLVQAYSGTITGLNEKINAVTNSAQSYNTTIDRNGKVTSRTLTTQAKGQIAAYEQQRVAAEESLTKASTLSQTLQKQAKQVRDTSVATADYGHTLDSLPPQVRTEVEARGVEITARQVAKLARTYGLTPKQVKTIVTATHTDATVAQVQRLIDKAKEAGKTRVDFSGIPRGLGKAVSAAGDVASQGGARVAKNLNTSTGEAKANLDPFRSSVTRGAQAAVGPASAGGTAVGVALSQGVSAGFAPTQSRLVAAATAAVGAAIAAARARAKVNSPSKETAYIGAMMGDGLVQGLVSKKGAVTSAAEVLSAGILAALSEQDPVAANLQTINDYVTGQFDSALDASTKSIDRKYDQLQRVLDNRYKAAQARIKKNLDGKAQQKALDRAEKAHDSLADQIDRKRTASEKAAAKARSAAQAEALADTAAYRVQLAGVIQQQKDVKDAYDAQVQSLTELRQTATDYATGVRDVVTATGSLSTLAQSGATSLARLLKGRAKAAADAKKFADDIQALTAAGLNADDIKDLEAQGPAALKTAEAIRAGGADAITQLNVSMSALQATGQQLGDSTAQTLYGAGITAAQGLVDGLAAQQTALAAVATTLGQQIAAGLAAGLTQASTQATAAADQTAHEVIHRVKTTFKTRSPSRVFEDIGVNVVRGLGRGLAQDTYATRPAATLAERVIQRGTPALNAYLGSAQPVSPTQQVAMTDGARNAPLIGTVNQQPGESVGVLAERLDFLIRTRG